MIFHFFVCPCRGHDKPSKCLHVRNKPYIYIYIYIHCVCEREFRQQILLWVYFITYEREGFGDDFFFWRYHFCECDVSTECKSSVIIVSCVCNPSPCTFDLRSPLSRIRMWPHHRLWNILRDRLIFRIRAFIACSRIGTPSLWHWFECVEFK